MTWDFKGDKPLYLQIMEHIKFGVVSGTYPVGSKMLSVRELAMEASVNPNTMQKALSELEKEGLLFSQRTSGRFITEDEEAVAQIRKNFLEHQMQDFFEKMQAIGYNSTEVVKLFTDFVNERKDEHNGSITGMPVAD